MLKRRDFIRQSAALGAMACVNANLLSSCGRFINYDISVIHAQDYYKATLEAVKVLGGMSKFVGPGSKVALLINSDFEHVGAFVNPDISLAAVKMILESGASEITLIQTVKDEYWQRSSHYESHKEMIESLKQVQSNTFPATFNEEEWVKVDQIPGAKSLKEAEIVKKTLECDVFINIPVSKHHMTTLLTGALKNIMGINTRKSNVTFHLGSGIRNDPEYLAQCIADINLLRKTDLCIVDSTEFITTNGPSGPGELMKPDIVLAGTDIIAMDAMCSGYMGYAPDEILTTVKGSELGIGTMATETLNIKEITI